MMLSVEIKPFCCGLRKFIVIVASLMICLHSVLFVTVIAGLTYNSVSHHFTGNFLNVVSFVVIIVVSLCIAFAGFLTNVLLLIGVKYHKRFFLLPWLVLHVFYVLGLFAGSIYIVIHFTVLIASVDISSRIWALISLFPLFGAILLIFMWIMVDQLYIQLKTGSKLRAASTTEFKSSTTSILPKFPSAVNRNLVSFSPSPNTNTIPRIKNNKSCLTYASDVSKPTYPTHNFKSLPRFIHGNKKSKNQNLNQHEKSKNKMLQRHPSGIMKKSKSLEAILIDSSVSSANGPNYWISSQRHWPKEYCRSGKATDSTSLSSKMTVTTNGTSSRNYKRRRQPKKTSFKYGWTQKEQKPMSKSLEMLNVKERRSTPSLSADVRDRRLNNLGTTDRMYLEGHYGYTQSSPSFSRHVSYATLPSRPRARVSPSKKVDNLAWSTMQRQGRFQNSNFFRGNEPRAMSVSLSSEGFENDLTPDLVQKLPPFYEKDKNRRINYHKDTIFEDKEEGLDVTKTSKECLNYGAITDDLKAKNCGTLKAPTVKFANFPPDTPIDKDDSTRSWILTLDNENGTNYNKNGINSIK